MPTPNRYNANGKPKKEADKPRGDRYAYTWLDDDHWFVSNGERKRKPAKRTVVEAPTTGEGGAKIVYVPLW